MSPRTAYILTKIAVFVVAAVLTWPLSKIVGPKAWWGLAVFGLVLIVLTAAVFLAFGRKPVASDCTDDEEEEMGLPDPEDPVELPVEDFIDLHPFPPRDIPDIVTDYLDAAHAAGFREVRLIHGRGVGVQRERVRSTLSKNSLVETFSDAPADRGGWGATIARLSNDKRAK